MLRPLVWTSAFVSLLLAGAIFGFFYAWACSAMWGFDAAEPRVAIEAMQAVNRIIKNAAFAPAFFGAPIALLITAGLAFAAEARIAALWFAIAAIAYILGGIGVTMIGNLPLNDALATIEAPADPVAAETIWTDYSTVWKAWNWTRTAASGAALLLTGLAIRALARR